MTTQPTNETRATEKDTAPSKESPKGVLKKPVRKTAKKKTEKAATKKAKAKKPAKSAAKKPKAATAKPTGKITTLDELCAAFLEHLTTIGKSPGTARSYSADLAVAKKYFGGDTKLKSLTAKKVATFFASDEVTKLRDGREKNPVTTAKIRRVFRQMMEFATEAGLFSEAPLPAKK